MIWTLLGIKPKNWRQTEQNGVKVWPNASIGMRVEHEDKVRAVRTRKPMWFVLHTAGRRRQAIDSLAAE